MSLNVFENKCNECNIVNSISAAHYSKHLNYTKRAQQADNNY
jgi:hypothetical protein